MLWRINVRQEEHLKGNIQKAPNSSLGQHTLQNRHKINFDGAETIAQSDNSKSRTISEAVELEKRLGKINKRDYVLHLPTTRKSTSERSENHFY